MKEDYLKEVKKEVIGILIIIFSITYFMGIILFLVYKNLDKSAGQYFALVQMLYPAFAVVCVKLYYEKEKMSKELINFFKAYILFFVLSMVVLIVGLFAYKKYIESVLNILIGVFSLIAFIKIISDKRRYFEDINMVFNKKLKTITLMALILIGLILISFGISACVFGTSSHQIRNLIGAIVSLPIMLPLNIIMGFIAYFGEEFGWRGYLQPRLQILFGKKLGVILLGVIWGMWHLPLCVTLYGTTTPICSIISYPFSCTFLAIFFGLAYMKTGNLWSTIILHMVNNSFAVTANGGQYNVITTPKDLIIGIAIQTVLFVPFLFAKEYRNNKSKELSQAL